MMVSKQLHIETFLPSSPFPQFMWFIGSSTVINVISAPSRRSDLQSLAYCMLHWHTGTLPWSGLTHPDKVAAVKQR